MSMQRQTNVVVVGGSLGGLFAGISLQRLGHHVRILERNPTPLLHDQGAGIVAGGDTQELLQKYDRTKTPFAVVSHMRQYLDREGRQIQRECYTQKMTSWDLVYHLLRANFDRVKTDYCDPSSVPVPKEDGQAEYRYGSSVTNITDLGPSKGIKVHFKNKKGEDDALVADLVIAADGASSTIRHTLLPDVERSYAGYVAWRGTVTESELSTSAADTFVEKFTFFHSPGLQILAYLIPGEAGSLQPGKRLVNWVWYCNYAEDSRQHLELMTDAEGQRHRITLPPGAVRTEVWQKQMQHAEEVLPPQFAEVVRKTKVPFVQTITDVIAPRAALFDGRVLLVGDALAGFRPHTAASTSQAAFHALKLAELVDGQIDVQSWEKQVIGYASKVQKHGVELGNRSQFESHPMALGWGRTE